MQGREEVKRTQVDLPLSTWNELEAYRERLVETHGLPVNRSALLRLWIAERLEKERVRT